MIKLISEVDNIMADN